MNIIINLFLFFSFSLHLLLIIEMKTNNHLIIYFCIHLNTRIRTIKFIFIQENFYYNFMFSCNKHELRSSLTKMAEAMLFERLEVGK